MKVKLRNKDEVKELFKHWGENSAYCYDTQTNSPERIGKHCFESNHASGSRSRFFEFDIEDAPRSAIDQLVRHEVGVCKNVQSFRYVNKNSFMYELPVEIIDNAELLEKYHCHMKDTIDMYGEIQQFVTDKTGSQERANEQARYVLPMATHSAFAFCLDIEALIHLMHKRLCTRTEDVTRKIVQAMRKEVLEVLPELSTYLVPECQYLLWCPEKKGCGAYPSKKELTKVLREMSDQEKEKVSKTIDEFWLKESEDDANG